MKKKAIISVVLLASVGVLGLTNAMSEPTPTNHTSVRTEDIGQGKETTPLPAVTPVVVPETPAPVASTPQTPVDWWRAQKEIYSEDEMSCFLSIVINQNIPTNASPEVLNQALSYALDNYGSTCKALARLSNVPKNY